MRSAERLASGRRGGRPGGRLALQSAAAPISFAPGLLYRLEPNPRRNPALLALWLVGAGFVVYSVRRERMGF